MTAERGLGDALGNVARVGVRAHMVVSQPRAGRTLFQGPINTPGKTLKICRDLKDLKGATLLEPRSGLTTRA